jgi:hypothetical protein
MSPDWASGPAIYELTVAGAIGPVLRYALRPHRVARMQVCTILRWAPEDRDLADVMLLLESKGLTVEDVSTIDTPRRQAPRDAIEPSEGPPRHLRPYR